MGAWGPGPLENDAAWDTLDRLAGSAPGSRAAVVLSSLGAEVPWDLDDAAEAVVAALLVAMARDPAHFAGDRARIADHVSRTADVATFADLVGDRKALRTPVAARAALAALETARRTSELASLWAGDEAWAAGLDAVASALAAPTAAWPASADRPRESVAVRKVYTPGTLVGVDLGDGRRGYLVYRAQSLVTAFGAVSRLAEQAWGADRVLSSPVAFTTWFNDYVDVPDEWSVVGLAPRPQDLPEPPVTFMQHGIGMCTLYSHDFRVVGEAEAEECMHLERYGVAWSPSSVTERLLCHHEGRPHAGTESQRPLVRRSRFRVVPRTWPHDAESDPERPTWYAFTDLPDALRLATGSPEPADAVLVEVDEATLDRGHRNLRPVDPNDRFSPLVPWACRVRSEAVLAVHELRRTPEGYEPMRPVVPRHP